MSFRIGDFVHVVDEDLSGNILSISDTFIVICCTDGFEYKYRPHQILKINATSELVEFTPSNIEETQFMEPLDNSTSTSFNIKFQGKKPEFDLHIEELFPDKRFFTKHKALTIQLDFVRAVIEKANRLRIRNLVFIHGVGQGILRDQLRVLFKENYPQIEFFDASYKLYGSGATELIIHGLGRT